MAVSEKDYPVKVGTFLFTMVEPHEGSEVAYNRWYEHDHFYSGCLMGPNVFAGDRFVATRRLKKLRSKATNDMTPDPKKGSYLAVYWWQKGTTDECNRWNVDNVNMLHRQGRMFAERDHIHTLLYDMRWSEQRDPKGLYGRARRGEIPLFTGISAGYEVPENPGLILQTHEHSVSDCIESLLAMLEPALKRRLADQQPD